MEVPVFVGVEVAAAIVIVAPVTGIPLNNVAPVVLAPVAPVKLN